ncbi:MAG: hypothetical protein NT071_12635 [Burkholderiales bacterium]|nr:hypothetical protein [Burkholderiales bacterium]
MRFASYTTGGTSGWGLLVDGCVLDGRQLGEGLPPTLREFILFPAVDRT